MDSGARRTRCERKAINMQPSRRTFLKNVAASTAATPLLSSSRLWSEPKPMDGHLENPFVDATFYRNVDYVAAVKAAAELQGGTLGKQMKQVANYPTFVWMDCIAAVNGTKEYPRSLAGHLD